MKTTILMCGKGWGIEDQTLEPVITNLEAFRSEMADNIYTEPLEMLWRGRAQEALDTLLGQPETKRSRALIADCYRALGQYGIAAAIYRELMSAEEFSSRQAVYRQHLGKVYFAEGDYVAALKEFEASLAIRRSLGVGGNQLASSEQATQRARELINQGLVRSFKYAHLPVGEYALPGEVRERLVSAIASGRKTATSTLLAEYEQTGESLPMVGYREQVVDSWNRYICTTEITSIEVLPASKVDHQFVREEGEGLTNWVQWWSAHREFWTSSEFLEAVGELEPDITEDVLVVCTRFKVIHVSQPKIA